MLDDRIGYSAAYWDEENETVSIYFSAPKELLPVRCPEAVGMVISLEVSIQSGGLVFLEPAQFSPTKRCDDGSLVEDDWSDLELSDEAVEDFLDIAAVSGVFSTIEALKQQ